MSFVSVISASVGPEVVKVPANSNFYKMVRIPAETEPDAQLPT
jgi:hypothetical protein